MDDGPIVADAREDDTEVVIRRTRIVGSNSSIECYPALGGSFVALMSTRSAGLIAVAIIVLTFWYQHALLESLRRDLNDRLRETSRPVLLSGLRIEIAPFVDAPVPTPDGIQGFVIFVAADDCQFSQQALPEWTTAIIGTEADPRVPYLFLSIKGTSIVDAAATAARGTGAPVEVRRITNELGFAQATGVAWTPQVFAVDRAMTVRAVAPRLAPDTIRRMRVRVRDGADTPAQKVSALRTTGQTQARFR